MLKLKTKALIKRADELHANGEFSEALREYVEAEKNERNGIPLEKKNVDYYGKIADCYLRTNNSSKAIECYTIAIAIAGDMDIKPRAALYNSRGACYFKSGYYGSAYEDFTQAIRLSPEIPTYYKNRAECNRKLGKDPQTIIKPDIEKANKLEGRAKSKQTQSSRGQAPGLTAQGVPPDSDLNSRVSSRGYYPSPIQANYNQPAVNMQGKYAQQPAANMQGKYAQQPAANMQGKYAQQPAANMQGKYAQQPAANMQGKYAQQPAVNMQGKYAQKPMQADYSQLQQAAVASPVTPVSSQQEAKLVPYSQAYYKNKAYDHMNQGEHEDAVKYFSSAIEMDKDNSQLYFDRATCYDKIGTPDDFRKAANDREMAETIIRASGNDNGEYWSEI